MAFHSEKLRESASGPPAKVFLLAFSMERMTPRVACQTVTALSCDFGPGVVLGCETNVTGEKPHTQAHNLLPFYILYPLLTLTPSIVIFLHCDSCHT